MKIQQQNEYNPSMQALYFTKSVPTKSLLNLREGHVFTENRTQYLKDESAKLTPVIKEAIAEINRCRRFTPTKDVLYDSKYEDMIVPLCVSALSKIGAEGQTSHSENGIVRGYGNDGKYPSAMLKSIKPLIK